MRHGIRLALVAALAASAACSGGDGGGQADAAEVPSMPSPFCGQEVVLHTGGANPNTALAVTSSGRIALVYIDECNEVGSCSEYANPSHVLHLVTETDGNLNDEVVAVVERDFVGVGFSGPDVAFDSDGRLHVIVGDNSDDTSYRARHFVERDGVWSEATVASGFQSTANALATGPGGLVAALVGGLQSGATFGSFDGTSWTTATVTAETMLDRPALVHRDGSWHASLVLDAEVGYQGHHFSDETGAWQGELLADVGGSYNSNIAVDRLGAPIVFYDRCLDNCNTADVTAQRRLEAGWQAELVSEYRGLSDVTRTHDGRLAVLHELNGSLSLWVESDAGWQQQSLQGGVDGRYTYAQLDGLDQLHVLSPRAGAAGGIEVVYSVRCDLTL